MPPGAKYFLKLLNSSKSSYWIKKFQFSRGLMLAVMVAALMSSLTSIFNSSSAIFTMVKLLYVFLLIG